MNILYVSSKKGWAGVVSWMVHTASGLNEKGHRVFIISHPDSELSRRAPYNLKIINKKLGFDLNPCTILYLVRFIKHHSIDIIVTNIKKEVLIGGIAAKICNITHIRRIGTYLDLNHKVRWLHGKLIDHNIIPADAVFEKAVKSEKWLERKDFTTIYNGRNRLNYSVEDRSKIRTGWGIVSDEIVIGSTSKLSKVKGIDKLIIVFAELHQEIKNIKLIITGEGQEKKNLLNLIDLLNIKDSVIFNGFSENPIYTAAGYDIAVLNSSLEGFPNSIVEYMAAGVPVVATNIDGVNEIVKNGKNGLLIELGEDKDLYDALKLLVNNSKLREQMGLEATRVIDLKFSENQMVKNLENLFQGIIEKN